MKLSLPIFRLKRTAKTLSRDTDIPLHKALDQVARSEGFRSWSQLAAKCTTKPAAKQLLNAFAPGDLVLLAARPEHGKTMLSLDLLSQAAAISCPAHFFTLEYNDEAATRALNSRNAKGVVLDTSNDICADHIITVLNGIKGAVAAIDYMQLLDQKRSHPPLADQMAVLKLFALDTGAILIFTAQIDRSFDQKNRPMPEVQDLRLPNPVNLGIIDKICFLHSGQLQLANPSMPSSITGC